MTKDLDVAGLPAVLDRHAAIEGAELFRELNHTALRDIASASSIRYVEKGCTLFNQGGQADHLFLVGQGKFKVASLAKDGSQRTLRFMGPGQIIGCAAVFNRAPYPATATAIVDSIAVIWTASQFDEFLRTYPKLATNALALVGSRTFDILRRLHETASNNVEQRIATSVVRLVEQNSSSDPETRLQLRLSRQDLAELSDSSLFSVSRTVAEWARAGIVAPGRQRMVIRDLARLKKVAGVQD